MKRCAVGLTCATCVEHASTGLVCSLSMEAPVRESSGMTLVHCSDVTLHIIRSAWPAQHAQVPSGSHPAV